MVSHIITLLISGTPKPWIILLFRVGCTAHKYLVVHTFYLLLLLTINSVSHLREIHIVFNMNMFLLVRT